MNEKIYKRMSISAAGAIATGIVTLVVGVACGIVMIVTGANLLKARSDTLF